MKLSGDKETFTAQVTYDTQELYGKVEARYEIAVEPGPAVFRPVEPFRPVKPVTKQTLQDRLQKRLPGARRLATSAFVASWSPDGNQIVYGKTPTGAGLRILNVQTGATTDLMSSGKDPAWSAKEPGRIAFVRGGPSVESEEIWIVEPTGKNARKIAEGGFPTWSADGKTVFFGSRKAGKIMAIEPDRADASPAAASDVSSSYYPAVSPDGKRMAFQAGSQLVVWDRDTGNAVRRRPLPGWQGLLPGWSPDGKWVGFGSYGGQNQVGLWILEVDTGREVMVAEGPYTMPAWSKDGSKFAFDLRASEGWEIWMVETKALQGISSARAEKAPATIAEPAQPVEGPRRSPARRTIPDQNLQIPDEMQACAAKLRKISAAIKKYEKDKGKMPDWLSDLVPDYLDKESLLCPTTRTEKVTLWPDPKLPCSYVYEFSPTRVSSGWGAVSGMVCRDWKARQVKFFGDGVPAVRCTHGSRSLNASAGGQVYWSFGTWEFVFMPDYRRGDELGTPPSPLQPRTPDAAFDGFDGKLSLKWQIRNADPSHVSLTKRPGTLTITTQEGSFLRSGTDYKNLFLIENRIPQGRDFELTTCLVSFKPSAAFQQAGLVCFNDHDNYIKWADECGNTPDQRYLSLIRETGGNVAPHTYVDGGVPRAERLWLRLTKRGNRYICSSSSDGKSFQVHLELAWGDGAPKFVGLVAINGTASKAPEIDASFDFFEIREKLVVEPAPATPPTAKPARIIESGAAGLIRLLAPVSPPPAKSGKLIQTEGVKPIQVDKKKGEPR